RVMGKGRKERIIPLNDLALDALRAYLAARPISHETALFLNRFGGRLSGRMVEKLVDQYCRQAGISQKGISPHKLRHTFATLLHSKDVELIEIQNLMGHSSIVSTEIYTHTSTHRLQHAVDKIAL
ncbi:MAG: tyrosine-type recombinase/integrase, partial [Candidatus Sumerlaeota bacterium]|nr:tyrosine-type recombinase/integrase [Candidatus Sumerlaeota bacterium]